MERCLAQAGGSLRPVITEKEALSLTTDILDGLAGLSPHSCARPYPPHLALPSSPASAQGVGLRSVPGVGVGDICVSITFYSQVWLLCSSPKETSPNPQPTLFFFVND